MKHFKKQVSKETQEKMLRFIEHMKDDDALSDFCDGVDEPKIEEIQGLPVEGFIPYQDGGYCLSGLTDDGYGSGCFVSATHKEYVHAAHDEAYEDGLEEAKKEGLTGEDAETYARECETEDESLGYMFIECEVYQKEGKIIVALVAKYADAPYFRDASGERFKRIEIGVDKFNSMAMEDIQDALYNS